MGLEVESSALLSSFSVEATLQRLAPDGSLQAEGDGASQPVLRLAAGLEPCWTAGDTSGKATAGQAGLGAVARLSANAMALPGRPPALWSAEEPNLYLLVLALKGRQGEVLEYEACQVRCAGYRC